MTGNDILDRLSAGTETFARLYGAGEEKTAVERYRALAEEMLESEDFRAERGGRFRVFTAAGRTELGGNHTDHNLGKVLAASIQLDQAAVVIPRNDGIVFYRSLAYPDVRVDLSDLEPREEEKGKTEALVRGVAAEFVRRGIKIGGFSANAASTVLPGSGLSSSAAVEVLFGCIFDSLYGGKRLSSLEIAQIGQKAENLYFGKPCGLMDQTACASGGVVAIDFGDRDKPQVKNIRFDPGSLGLALCVVNTGGSHADLTPDYAAIPSEMKAAAGLFGKTALRELDRERLLERAREVRESAGDRALLRALHFFDENDRVDRMTACLKEMENAVLPEEKQKALGAYLKLVNESGDSSWELLQNVYSTGDSARQGISAALALTRNFFRSRGLAAVSGGISRGIGACRVHGGGFAGAIQAYLPLADLDVYRLYMEAVFGPGSVTPLRIRPVGAAEIVPGDP